MKNREWVERVKHDNRLYGKTASKLLGDNAREIEGKGVTMKTEISKVGGVGRASRWLAVALVLAGASGCATSSQQRLDTAASPMNDASPVSGPLSTFLDSAATGSVTTLATSPWGANVSVHARERYFSASGRRCIRLDVTRNVAPAGVPVGEVTCLVPGKGWYAQRLVTEIIR